jgi:hypothetical protein
MNAAFLDPRRASERSRALGRKPAAHRLSEFVPQKRAASSWNEDDDGARRRRQ